MNTHASNDSTYQYQLPLHPRMVTQSQVGVQKPNPKYSLIHDYNSIPKEPHIVTIALSHTSWKEAMDDKLATLSQNNTWILFPRASSMNVVRSR